MSIEVAGFQYSAELYCPEHMEEIAQAKGFDSLIVWGDSLGIDLDNEETWDSGDFPKVILNNEEAGDSPDTCAICSTVLDTSWHSSTVNTAVEQLAQYVVATVNKEEHRGNAKYLDEVHERLTWCIVDRYDDLVMRLYDLCRLDDDD